MTYSKKPLAKRHYHQNALKAFACELVQSGHSQLVTIQKQGCHSCQKERQKGT